MKIAITGGAGFIGTVLARILIERGHTPILIDLKKSETYPEYSAVASVEDQEAITKACAGADVIYHMAALHRDDISPISRYTEVNVEGGKNVIAAAKANNIQTIIFTSSVAVYPLEPINPATGSAESDPPAPFNPYGQSKAESEKTFEDWAYEDEQRKLVTVRLVATFGPGNHGNIFKLMRHIARGKFVMIGNGKNCKSIAYVENVAAFLVHTLSLGKGAHLYNYADKPDINMRDFVLHVRSALGRKGLGLRLPYICGLMGGMFFDVLGALRRKKYTINSIRIKKFTANTIVSANRIEETGFKPAHSLEDGLKIMIESEFTKPQKHSESLAEHKKAA